MANETQVIQLEFVINARATGLVTQMEKVNAIMASYRQNLAAVKAGTLDTFQTANTAFETALVGSGQYTVHTGKAIDATAKFGKTLEDNKFKFGQYVNMIRQYRDEATRATSQIQKLAEQQVRYQNAVPLVVGKNAQGQSQTMTAIPTGLDMSNLATRTAVLAKAQGALTVAFEQGSRKLIDWGKNTQWAGRQLTVGLTVPLAAAAAGAIALARQVEGELTSIQKVYDFTAQDMAGQTKEWAQVRADSLAMATDAAATYGAKLQDTLQIESQLAAAGKKGNDLLQTTQDVVRATALTFQNGTASTEDYMNVFNATISLQNIFKLKAGQTADAFNYLNAVENATVLKMSDFIDAIPRSFGPLHTLGLSLTDIGTLLTAMKANGVTAAQGSNALKSALVSLLNPTTAAQKAFKAVNIDIKELVTSHAGNLMKVLEDLSKQMEKMSPTQEESLLARLFGKYQMARIDAVIKGLRDVNDATTQVGRAAAVAAEGQQVWADQAKKQLDRFAASPYQQFQIATAKLQAQVVLMGDTLFGVGTKIVNIFERVLEIFNQLPAPIKAIVEGVGVLAAAVGPILMLFGTFAGNFIGNVLNFIVRGIEQFRKRILGHVIDKDIYQTPETIAAEAAQKALTDATYSQVEATKVLRTAVVELSNAYADMIEKQGMSITKDAFLQAGISGPQVGPSATRKGAGGTVFSQAMIDRYGLGAKQGYGGQANIEAQIAQAAVMRPEDVLGGGLATRSLSSKTGAGTFVAGTAATYKYLKDVQAAYANLSREEIATMAGISEELRVMLLRIRDEGLKIVQGDFSHFKTGSKGATSISGGFIEAGSVNKARGEQDVQESELTANAARTLRRRMQMTDAEWAKVQAAAAALAAATVATKTGEMDFGKILAEGGTEIAQASTTMTESLRNQIAREQASWDTLFAARKTVEGVSIAQLEESKALTAQLISAERKEVNLSGDLASARAQLVVAYEDAAAATMMTTKEQTSGGGLRGKLGNFMGGSGFGGKAAGIGGAMLGVSMLASFIPQNGNQGLAAGQDALNGMATGSLMGMLIGPEGAVIGGALGAAVGGITGILKIFQKNAEEAAAQMKKVMDTAGTTSGTLLSANALAAAGAKNLQNQQLHLYGSVQDPAQNATAQFAQSVKDNFADQIQSIKDASDKTAATLGKEIYGELILNGVPAQAARNIIAQVYREAGKQGLVIPVTAEIKGITSKKGAMQLIDKSSQNQLNELARIAAGAVTQYSQETGSGSSGRAGGGGTGPMMQVTAFADQFKEAIRNMGKVGGRQLFLDLQASIDDQSPTSVANALTDKVDQIVKASFSAAKITNLDSSTKGVLESFGINASQSLDKVGESILKLSNDARGKLYTALTESGQQGKAFVESMKASESGTDQLVAALDNLQPGLGDTVAMLIKGKDGATGFGAALQFFGSDVNQVAGALDGLANSMSQTIIAKGQQVVASMQARFKALNDSDALQARIDAREQKSADAIDKMKNAYEAQIKAINDAEDAKQKAFAAEQERLQRQQQMHNLQVQLAQDIAGGDLFAANRDANDMSMIGRQNAAADAAKASQDAADKRVAVLKDEEDKKSKIMQDAADKQKKADQAMMKAFNKNAQARVDAENKAEAKVVADHQAAADAILKIWQDQGAAGLPAMKKIADTWGINFASALQKSITGSLGSLGPDVMKVVTSAIQSSNWTNLGKIIAAATGPSALSGSALASYIEYLGEGNTKAATAVLTAARRGMATGGHITGPGSGKSDSIPAMLSNGEYVVSADAVKKYGVANLDKINRQKFAKGGLADSLMGSVGVQGFTDSMFRILGILADTATGPASVGGGAGIGNKTQGTYKGLLPPGAKVARWLPDVNTVLGLLHQPLMYAKYILDIIKHESGGNPNAINLWDSNAKRGDPSRGLMQTIMTTFKHYNDGPYKGRSIYDPLANIYAGVHYGISRYHGITKIPGIASELHGGPYKPYALGGYVGVPSLRSGAMRINYDNTIANLHAGERVLTAPMTNKFDAALDRLASGGAGGYDITVKVDKINATPEDIGLAVVRAIDDRERKLGRDRTVRSR